MNYGWKQIMYLKSNHPSTSKAEVHKTYIPTSVSPEAFSYRTPQLHTAMLLTR